jgi:hypothetical protein
MVIFAQMRMAAEQELHSVIGIVDVPLGDAVLRSRLVTL